MLWSAEYSLRCLVWQKGGGKGRRPRPMATPAERARRDRALATAEEARTEVDAALAAVMGARGSEGDDGEGA